MGTCTNRWRPARVRRGMAAWVLGAAVAAGALACKPKPAPEALASASAQPSASASAAPQAPPSFEPRVKLLEAGREPRSVLAFALKAGTRQDLESLVANTVKQTANGKDQPVPPQNGSTLLAATVASVEPMGAFVEIRCARGASLTRDPAIDDALAKSVVRVLVTPSGLVREAGAQGPALESPAARGLLRDVSTNLVTGAWPFPAEPVGVGAKWQVAVTLPEGLTTEMVVDVELVERDAEHVKLVGRGKVTAAPQPYRIPGMRLGEMLLDRFTGSVEGERVLRLAQPLAVGTLQAKTHQYATVKRPAGDAKVETQTETTKTFREVDPAAIPAAPSAGASAGPAPSVAPPPPR